MSTLDAVLARVAPLSRLWRRRSFHEPRRVLILKPCCVGDVLLATPTLAAFQRAFPDAEFVWAIAPHSRAMVANNPRLDGLIDAGTVVGGADFTWREFLSLGRRLRAGDFDTAIVLERSLVLSLLPLLAGIPQRIGLDSRGRGLLNTHAATVPAQPHHEAELYLDTARCVDVPTRGARSEFYPSEAAREAVAPLVTDDLPLVSIHPAGGENPGTTLLSKRWPTERFAEVARRLTQQGMRVIVLGGPNDTELGAEVAGEWAENQAGGLSWDETGAVLEHASLFIGNDTGAMHLAVACGVPAVALFGPTDPARYGPYSSSSVALWHRVGCNPCFVDGAARPDCCPNHAIEAISVEEVLVAVERLLNERANGGTEEWKKG